MLRPCYTMLHLLDVIAVSCYVLVIAMSSPGCNCYVVLRLLDIYLFVVRAPGLPLTLHIRKYVMQIKQ